MTYYEPNLHKSMLGMAVGMMTLCPLAPVHAQQSQLVKVASNDCGVSDAQPFLISGENYTLSHEFKGAKASTTCNYGGKVIYAFDHLDIQADYQLEVVYLSDGERQQHIVVDGEELHAVDLKPGEEQRHFIKLPKKAYAYGQLVLVFELDGQGPNALVSELNLYSSNPKAPVPFEGEAKEALRHTVPYKVNTQVDVEKVLPVYAAVPSFVKGVYRNKLSLNGEWLFHPQPEKEFYKRPATADWKTIAVPGQWSMQGFAVDSMAYAGYRKTFTLPDDWREKTIKLRFDGVYSECRVFLNGTEVGAHLGGMTAYELDITSQLRKGPNELSLLVRSESLADMLGSLTQYAVHQLGGITRKVTLFAVPRTHVSDLRIVTSLDKDYENVEKSEHAVTTYKLNKTQKIVDFTN